jgi:hypothetical protein
MNTSKKPRRMARSPNVVEGHGIDIDVVQGADASPVGLADKRITKQSLVIDLLHQEGGASLAAIIEATGWLPHTARAALSGLRKKGHAIERTSVDGVTRYATAAAA